MARVLIVGCGCRGRALASDLVAAGHVVRGTTRAESSLAAIESTGAEAARADPDRLATLLPQLEGVSAVCWLMGSARAPALHGARLQSLIDKLVDTPVRGMVYEAAGDAGPVLLERGAAMVRAASETYRMPVEVVEAEPSAAEAWLAAMRGAVGRIL
jgi:hypothetical protein